VMRMMSFVMEKGVPRCIVRPCGVGFVVLGFAGDVVDDLDR